MTNLPPIVHNAGAKRFEATVDAHLAELVYRREGQWLDLVHTGVPDALEGRGVGGALVRAAVDEAEQQGLTIIPSCSFAAAWLERHPDVADRVTVQAPDA